MFYDLRHKTLFCELVKMRMDGHAVDALTVHLWLKEHKLLDAAGGLAYLADLPEKSASFLMLRHYVEHLKRYALLRWSGTSNFDT